MNQTEQVLLQAIQKSLWNRDIGFPEDADWNAVLKEAEKQAILGIVAPAAPEQIQIEWESKVGHVPVNFIRILHYQDGLCRLLREADIPFVILKGTAAAMYYPDPTQRTMGDIDYLVPEAHFDRAAALLTENGYSVDEKEQTRRHIQLYKDSISFEQHHFFSSGNVNIEPYIMPGVEKAETRNIYGKSFPVLPKLENGLVLLAHLAQHLRSALGLRQIIDWMLYVHTELDDLFWEQRFHPAAQEAGLETIALTATRMCQKYLGLPDQIEWCKTADEALCDMLLERVLFSGNFGKKLGEGFKVEHVARRIKQDGLFRTLQTAGEEKWAAYHRHAWLRPFAWIYQIGRYAKQGFQSKRSGMQLKEDIMRSNQSKELLDKLNIRE